MREILMRLMAWALLLGSLLFLQSCMDATEIEVREIRVERGDDGAAADQDASPEDTAPLSDANAGDSDERTEDARFAEEVAADPRFDEEYQVVERDPQASAPLQVDRNAPALDILTVNRIEGPEGHFIALECDDQTPGLPDRWYDWSRRISRECRLDLATAVRAISFEPAQNFRIAPTATGLRLLGDFAQGDAELVIAPGLRTEEGAVLQAESRHPVHFPRLSGALSFTAQGRYLPRSAWEDLTIRHRNVDEVEIEVRHIPPQNLAFYLSEPIPRWGNLQEEANERVANVVATSEMALRVEEDEHLTSRLALQDLVPRPAQGLYQIDLSGNGASARFQIQVTDLNLIAKRHEKSPEKPWEDAIDVWAVDMESTRPIAATRVEVIRPSGQVMARCNTDVNGYCRLQLPDDTTDPSEPMAILARKGDDMTYLRFRDVPTEVVDGRIDGESYLKDISYRATLHGDRDLYRPGDTFYLVGALREPDLRAAGAAIPTQIVVRDPQNKVVVEELLQTNEAGLIDLSFKLNEIAPTGRWRAELLVGGRTLQTYPFFVEEFVPERLEVRADADQERIVGDDEAKFTVSARYLFGADATGSQVEATCQVRGLDGFERGGFTFGPARFDERAPVQDLPAVTARIDEDNQARITCPSLREPLDGAARITANFAVSEAGSGRATRASARTTYHPDAFQIGLQSEVETLKGGDTFGVRGLIVDLDGQPIDDFDQPVALEFFNVRTHWTRQYNNQTGGYTWETNYQFFLERVVDVTPREGRFRVETTTGDVAGAYLVRARAGQTRSDLRIERQGYYWDWSASADSTPRALRPTAIEFQPPAQAALNAPTTLTFDAPFAGRTLITVETAGVLQQRWLDAEAGRNEFTFTLTDEVPNVYVTAFVIRDPRHASDASFSPERAFGAVSIPVDRSRHEMQVQLDLPDEIRTDAPLQVGLKAHAPAAGSSANAAADQPLYATVAVVDEGVLQLTNYASPNPLNALFARRALGVSTFDTVGWSTQLPPEGPSARTGGGDFEGEDMTTGRIMPFKPVALFEGPIRLDPNGEATIDFEIPNYRGRLRVMAVVFGPDRIGSQDADVLVRDPLTVDATFPRFLIAGDEVQIPVFLANLTDQDRTVDVEISATEYDLPGIFRPEGLTTDVLFFDQGTTQSVEIPAGTSRTIRFLARAHLSGGAASINVRATSGDLTTVDEAMIPFRAGGPLQRRTEQIALSEGSHNLTSTLTGWERGSEETTLWVSAMPEPQAFDHLEYLIRYPYGCAEQTISSTRPLLFISQLVEAISPSSVASSGGVDAMVDAGIARILSMQSASGAFAYWPGGSWYSTWVSAYAIHFLQDASALGYAVPESRLENAVEWLTNNVESTPDSAYAHYVLALRGQAQLPAIRRAINALPSSRDARGQENAYLLYAALYLGGDRSFEEELKNPVVSVGSGNQRSMGWSFFSERRRQGLTLSVFIDLFGTDPKGQELYRAVTQNLLTATDTYRNTQEVLWNVTGLGKWLQTEAAAAADVRLLINGQEVQPAGYVFGLPRWSIARLSERGSVRLEVDNKHDGRLFAVVTSEGVRSDTSTPMGTSGLRVAQTLLDANGDAVDGRPLQPAELVFTQITITNTTARELRNVALVSRLPAGLEVENQNLNAAELPAFARSTWEVDYSLGRDDRMEFFGTLQPGQSRQVYFAARATLSGEFHHPSLEAEAMYDPGTWGRAFPSTLTVTTSPDALVD